MTNRSRRSRKRPSRGPAQNARPGDVQVPSAATLFRFILLDVSGPALIDRAMSLLKPALWARDGGDVRRIRRAATPEELLDLLPLARGLGGPAWNKRMRQFGPKAVPLLSERLRTIKTVRDRDEQDMAVEKLIGVLRWHGKAGAGVLLERFDDLNLYGQSLACVVLGLLGAGTGADRIWRFYQEVVHRRGDSYFVGALWGLIDLKDERAGLALAQLLERRYVFYELFGFLSLAGDARAVLPLLEEISRRPDENKEEPMMASIAIAHRIGREALLAEFHKGAGTDDVPEVMEALADQILAKPVEYPQEYFELFYQGSTPDDPVGTQTV